MNDCKIEGQRKTDISFALQKNPTITFDFTIC